MGGRIVFTKREEKHIFLSHSTPLFTVISQTHKREIFTVIEAEWFITYSLLTLFVYPLTAKLRIGSYRPIRALITSICASPCPSFSRKIPVGLLAEIFCENLARSRRANWIREGTRDLGQNPFYSAPFLALLSRSSLVAIPSLPLVSHSHHSEPFAMAFPNPSAGAPLQCITMHRQLPKNVGDWMYPLDVSQKRFSEEIQRG